MKQLKWTKLGLIFDVQKYGGKSWFDQFAQAPASLQFDKFVRVYFSCRPKPDENGQFVSYTAFVDLDRSNPTKILRVSETPIMGLGAKGCFDEFGVYPASPIRMNNKVRLYYGGWTRCESVPFDVAIGVAESEDEGQTFKRLGNGPVLGASLQEPYVLSGPKIRKFNDKYYLFYIAGTKWKISDGRPEPVYRIRMAESEDGLSWTKRNTSLIPTKVEEDEAQASPDVFFWKGQYHMFFCYRHSENYRGQEFGYRIGYARSQDLVHWQRDDEFCCLTVSTEGWDSEMVAYPHVFEVDGAIYMAYLGNQVGRQGFGLAKLDSEL